MTSPSRVEELRRRVEQDPVSLSFAALAEEYRRLGHYEEAVRSCRLGLEHHPDYHSARTTLACALAELKQYEEAGAEFEHVLRDAPNNLRARKGLVSVLRHQGRLTTALGHLRIALGQVPQDTELPEAIAALEGELADAPPPSAPDPLPAARDARLAAPAGPSVTAARQIARLRGFLAAIERARADSASQAPPAGATRRHIP
jgi:tetratricopeptide (TPR) repeat protein